MGNLGLNSRLRASSEEPAEMYVGDFDHNGFVEQVVALTSSGKSYPLALRDDLLRTLPHLRSRFAKYEDYANKTIGEIFSAKELQDAVRQTAYTFATTLVRANADGSYSLIPLPAEAQVAPVYGILADDVDGDGKQDLLLAGNFYGFKPEIGRLTAGRGLVLRGDGKGGFAPMPALASGFTAPGQARDIQRLRTARGALYVVSRNDDRALVFASGH